MGADKASLIVEGTPIARRLAECVASAGASRVTILGREPLPPYSFLQDTEVWAGPFAALASFTPRSPRVLVLGCDLPALDPETVRSFVEYPASSADAWVPSLEGRAQPLCALYSATAWNRLDEVVVGNKRSMMAWLDHLKVDLLDEAALQGRGVDPGRLEGANDPGRLAAIAARYGLDLG